MSTPKNKAKPGNPNGAQPNGKSQFLMDDVKLLFDQLTTPETGVQFNPPTRASSATIQNAISNPPLITWTWKDQTTRQAQGVTLDDLGKYGIQQDISVLFRLTSVTPLVWQPIPPGTTNAWSWPNLARNAQLVSVADIGKIGIQTDINTLYQLVSAAPPVWQSVPNPTNTSSPFELSTGAADADSYHDFFRLQIAFEDVWAELLDQAVQKVGEQLYAHWDALMDQGLDDTGAAERVKQFTPLPNDEISGVDELNTFIENLKIVLGIEGGGASGIASEITQVKNDLYQTIIGCDMLLKELNRVGTDDGTGGTTFSGNSWLIGTSDTSAPGDSTDMGAFPSGVKRQEVFTRILGDVQSISPSAQDVTFPDLAKLLTALDGMLKETYRFDVFAPDSINFGLLLNYRQHWQPQSYQTGNLVTTIPLAPQETRRYTTKTIVKKTRNVKEIDDSVRSGKEESSQTWRVDAEIVDRAKNQTNSQKNASGSFGNDNLYKISASLQNSTDQAVESAQTKREFHESVIKSAQEYRNEHRLEISTEESREDESTSYREIRNPNDELTVTYLFYELQRRYLVDENLHKITPVILVANEVPAPHEIDQAWILRHDWIIKRAILDDSFLPALEYLSANYTGEELSLQVLELGVEQQKAVVDRISQQVQLANKSLDTATVGLENSESQEVQDLQNAETMSIVKSVFDPLGITKSGGDGNADRARVDFAKDALNRAQAKVNQLLADLKTETTALQVAIDRYTTAAKKHFSMLADIDRLRIHVKDNIIYYMQTIWSYEPADQRYFRLYNIDVPTFTHNTTVNFTQAKGLAVLDPLRRTLSVSLAAPTLADNAKKLHQVADIDSLIGFKGNYMIFPLVDFDYMTWFILHNYIDISESTGITAQDPEPGAGLTLRQLQDAMSAIAKDARTFSDNLPAFEEIMYRLLSKKTPEMVILPSNSLYIEALPGAHPLLEDFKLIHRAIDVKKAQAELRHAELENLRLAARLENTEYGDPDIDKVVVVGNGKNITVDAGQ